MHSTLKRQSRTRLPARATDGMTLMIVPHNQKHVLKVRLNLRLVYFITGLLAAIALVAIVSSLTVNSFASEKEKVLQQATGWQNKIWHFNHSQQRLLQQIEFLDQKGLAFYEHIWQKPFRQKPITGRDEYLARKLRQAAKPLKKSLDFLILREKSLRALPLGWPVRTGFISSDYGRRQNAFGDYSEFHTGYDFATAFASPIYATADGIVIGAGGGEGGLGLNVRILHKHGFVTVYGHCSKLLVRTDQRVKRGQVIALLGRTGNATGPHVHYEVKLRNPVPNRNFEVHLNPWPFLRETL